MGDIQAVFTGDLIDSRAAPEGVEATLGTLARAAAEFAAHHGLALRFTRHRGDGWQLLLARPALTLDLLLYLTARLRAAEVPLETRMGIALGAIRSPGTASLADAAGPAFEAAGQALEEVPRGARLQLAWPGAGPWQHATFALVTELTEGWTAAQAEAVALMLVPGHATHAALAARLGVSRQAAQSRLASAHFTALGPAREAFLTHDFADTAP
ncbi:hypothetical protein LR948_02555 [Roseivivax sp. GX 12232]|uniref:hypothetical protein n=1 Tax=Roseivivax sp. GX 12232 TaxID=2900547 RepID=UPI001E3D28D8|nr:hypothetical protein [Roseivivax sp. GX 12232]MCE0504222.1 hypothetical protein [Roseivivax sp. GX 12232]